MIDGQEDQALVVRSRNGDRAAFEQLVRLTARGIFTRLYILTADAHRAEDLVQETFLAAWKNIGSLSDPKLFRPWLRKIAKGVAIDAAKRDARKKRGWLFKRREQQSMLDLEDESDAPDETMQHEEEQRRVLKLLEDLPREYRDVISLRYLAGADYQTIAKQLAISNGSLRGLLSRGLKMLREKIGVTADEHR